VVVEQHRAAGKVAMRISFIIALSLAANLVLAALLFHRHDGATLPKTNDSSAEAAVIMAGAQRSAASAENSGAAGTQVSWRELHTDDLKEFIRRLRAANCPERTIEDLILAEVNRRYAPKNRALWPENLTQNDYWKPYRRTIDLAEQKKNRERMHAQQALQKEKSALLVELFGFDVEKQRLKEEGIDADMMGWNPNGSLSFLPESKRDAAQKILDDFQEKEQDFYASVQGAWDGDARARQKKLEQEKFNSLAQILTPEELREYKLRNSQLASQLSSDIRNVSLTREQYEALYDIREKYGDSIYNWSDAGNDADTVKQIEQTKKDMQAQITGALGAGKAQELERAQDYSYQQLAHLAKRNDLPADTASKIYDFKQAAEQAAQDLRSNNDLTPEQRQAALAQISSETQQSVKSALGDKLYRRYLNNGGWWLNNIAPARMNQN
jgi:hypothetical protein